MTSASAVYRLNRANAVAWAGLAAIAVYFAVLMHAVEAWPYDQWMVLILAPALLAIGTDDHHLCHPPRRSSRSRR